MHERFSRGKEGQFWQQWEPLQLGNALLIRVTKRPHPGLNFRSFSAPLSPSSRAEEPDSSSDKGQYEHQGENTLGCAHRQRW